MKGEGTQVIRISQSAYDTLKELSAKSRYDMSDIINNLMKQVEIMLHDGIEESNRISFMCDYDLKNAMVHLRFAPIISDLTKMPPSAQEYERKKRLEEDGPEPENHPLIKEFEISREHFDAIIARRIDQINRSSLAPDQKLELIKELEKLAEKQKGESA